MSLVAKSCNFISKLETLVLHVIILSVSATVIKITEARTANSMGVAPFSYAYTIPQYKKKNKQLCLVKQKGCWSVWESENLFIVTKMEWASIISSMAEIQEEKKLLVFGQLMT